MANKKENHQGLDEQLDLLVHKIVCASAANRQEAEAVSSSPFLYTRLRSRIAAESARREEGENWLVWLRVIWQAVPSMALIALFAFILFLSVRPGTPAARNLNDEALVGAHNTGVERVVFTDRNALTSDEVWATIIDSDREASR